MPATSFSSAAGTEICNASMARSERSGSRATPSRNSPTGASASTTSRSRARPLAPMISRGRQPWPSTGWQTTGPRLPNSKARYARKLRATAFLEKGEPFLERSPQHSVSTTGLAPFACQPMGPSSLKTALVENETGPTAQNFRQGKHRPGEAWRRGHTGRAVAVPLVLGSVRSFVQQLIESPALGVGRRTRTQQGGDGRRHVD